MRGMYLLTHQTHHGYAAGVRALLDGSWAWRSLSSCAGAGCSSLWVLLLHAPKSMQTKKIQGYTSPKIRSDACHLIPLSCNMRTCGLCMPPFPSHVAPEALSNDECRRDGRAQRSGFQSIRTR